jgi:hypothetical protein
LVSQRPGRADTELLGKRLSIRGETVSEGTHLPVGVVSVDTGDHRRTLAKLDLHREYMRSRHPVLERQ